jgi:undecaprenyl-diphosphatase
MNNRRSNGIFTRFINRTKMFEIALQLGAIVSVVVLYWRKFFDFSRWQFYVKLIIAVIPALVLGKLFSVKIDMLLESPLNVGITLLAGGIILLFIDKVFSLNNIGSDDKRSYPKAFIIGIWQCLAMIPGVSRSAASIIGGMQQKLTRNLTAAFSFYLAVPTMAAATGYKMLKTWKENPEVVTNTQNLKLLAVRNVVAFVVAKLAIKFFISHLQKHGFKLLGWYRIIVGIIVLMLIYSGNL